MENVLQFRISSVVHDCEVGLVVTEVSQGEGPTDGREGGTGCVVAVCGQCVVNSISAVVSFRIPTHCADDNL